VNNYSIFALNYLDLYKEHPGAKPLLEFFQQKYNNINFPYYTFSNKKNLLDYADPDSKKFVTGSFLQRKVIHLFDQSLKRSDSCVKVPLTRGSRADFFISSGRGDKDIFVDVKVYSPPTVIDIDQSGCEVVSRIGDKSGDYIISDRVSTLVASSLKKGSYPSNYVLIFGVNDFPPRENLLRYRAYQDLLNKEVLPKLIKDNNLQSNFPSNLKVYFGFYGKPPVGVTPDYFDEVQLFNLLPAEENLGYSDAYMSDLVKSYKK
jgi:hypothetical protein